ncbi:hypothetical protein [Laspinema olomoucense]|uniref:Uncharacterized protein n=1 Tax=Laspinema olomoucense D3b TaxID=2953688 RepID=A0ABT2N3F3_9CYAN|nr:MULTISPECIES: hypothetical protein [unclassified Laspinema]MCT7970890.1 hypothetical protein [Laspinema sp. D3d]MCT7976290.1 hypothetical protein [Laspinema sp. D3b]MCT7993836.1 hypothetical protein [Laspinema sp. D3c]
MQLADSDIDLFYHLYYSILIYVNQKFGLFAGCCGSEEMSELTPLQVNELRQQLYTHPYLFDLFAEENPLKIAPDLLQIVSSWHNFISGRFYIYSYHQNYAVLIADRPPSKAYGVLALDCPFPELVGSVLPVMVETVLLPFKNKIIYDGTLQPYPFYLGLSIKGSLSETYHHAVEKFGIIASLTEVAAAEPPPAPQPDHQLSPLSHGELLKFYLQSEENRKTYEVQIQELVQKSVDLKVTYYQEMGRLYAEIYQARWREIGIKKGWIALFEEMPIASGGTKAEVEGILKKIIPADRRKFVYIFRLKPGDR